MNIWKILQIEATTDTNQIRRAYAQMSKVYHPEREPERFQELYKAYQEALKYANTYQDDEDDFWGEDEEESDEYTGQSDEKDDSQRDSFEQLDLGRKYAGLEKTVQEEKEDTEWENDSFGDKLYTHVSAEIKVGLNAFQEYFLQQGPKDWCVFFATPAFLSVQFEEQFASLLAEFFKEQKVYAPEELPIELVRELFLAYDAFMEERGEELFEDGFTALFDVLFANQKIELILNQLEEEKYQYDRNEYKTYYSIYKRVIMEKDTQSTDIWEFHIGVGGISIRGGELCEKIAFIISEAPEFSSEVYRYLIHRLDLTRIKNSTRWQELEPIYQAIEGKGIHIDAYAEEEDRRPEEVRALMAEIKNWKKSQLTEADREGIRAFFEGELYRKYALDQEFLGERFYVYSVEEVMWPKIFLEEFVAYYDRLYEKTNSLAGRNLYHLMQSRIGEESTVGDDYTEITENRKEWVMKYFFEESFTKVWHSSTPNGMKSVYRTLLLNHMENLEQQQNYEWDLMIDGHLYAVKDGSNYVFMYDKINEKAVLSMEEYWSILEELLNVFTSKFFCLSSDKKKWADMLERIRKDIWQS